MLSFFCHKQFVFIVLLIILCFGFSVSPEASENTHFISAPNQSTTYLLFPDTHHLSNIIEKKGSFTLNAGLAYSSAYNGEFKQKNEINQLFEMEGFYLSGTYGVTERLTVSLEVPYYHFSKTRYREIIHTSMEKFYVNYVILNNKLLFQADRNDSSFGDMTVYFNFNPFKDDRGFSLFGGVELPTGSKKTGLSNGNTDLFAGTVFTRKDFNRLLSQFKFVFCKPGDIKNFEEIHADNYYLATLDWLLELPKGFSVLAQLCYNNSPLRSVDLVKLGSDSFLVTLGVAYKTKNKHLQYLLSFTEDATSAARAEPDYSFNAGISLNF